VIHPFVVLDPTSSAFSHSLLASQILNARGNLRCYQLPRCLRPALMPEQQQPHVFLVVAGGNSAAERHFEDTIKRKRTLDEVRRFLPTREVENLEKIYHSSNFIVWGAVPGPMNESRWEKMMPGDVVLIYNNGRIRFAGEIAAKVRNAELSRYFWRENDAGRTWELMYFIVNEEMTAELFRNSKLS